MFVKENPERRKESELWNKYELYDWYKPWWYKLSAISYDVSYQKTHSHFIKS